MTDYFSNNSYRLKISKNNPKSKLSDSETTIYQGSRKKKKKKKMCSISKNIFKAKWDLRTVSFFQKKLCVKKKIYLFLTCHSFVTIFSAKCFGNSIPIIKTFNFG